TLCSPQELNRSDLLFAVILAALGVVGGLFRLRDCTVPLSEGRARRRVVTQKAVAPMCHTVGTCGRSHATTGALRQEDKAVRRMVCAADSASAAIVRVGLAVATVGKTPLPTRKRLG